MNNEDKIRRYALLLLKFRPRSTKELELRLEKKGFAKEEIDKLIDELKKKGFIDDLKFSKLYASTKLDLKSLGLRSINFELKKKGVDEETRAKVVEDITKDYDEYEVVKELVSSRLAQYKRLDPATTKRRLYNFLLRRGFSSSVVWKVFNDLDIK